MHCPALELECGPENYHKLTMAAKKEWTKLSNIDWGSIETQEGVASLFSHNYKEQHFYNKMTCIYTLSQYHLSSPEIKVLSALKQNVNAGCHMISL